MKQIQFIKFFTNNALRSTLILYETTKENVYRDMILYHVLKLTKWRLALTKLPEHVKDDLLHDMWIKFAKIIENGRFCTERIINPNKYINSVVRSFIAKQFGKNIDRKCVKEEIIEDFSMFPVTKVDDDICGKLFTMLRKYKPKYIFGNNKIVNKIVKHFKRGNLADTSPFKGGNKKTTLRNDSGSCNKNRTGLRELHRFLFFFYRQDIIEYMRSEFE